MRFQRILLLTAHVAFSAAVLRCWPGDDRFATAAAWCGFALTGSLLAAPALEAVLRDGCFRPGQIVAAVFTVCVVACVPLAVAVAVLAAQL